LSLFYYLEKQRPFDFLIDGEFLRTSLSEYLEEKGMSTENLLTIEYVESMLPPTPLSSYEHDDWVSAVKAHRQGGFLTGSYDNHVRLWNKQAECTQILTGHNGAVKAVQWLKSDGKILLPVVSFYRSSRLFLLFCFWKMVHLKI
jgi:ribosome biogenesis protein YTM1